MPNQYTTLRRDENQARGIAQFALDFLNATGDGPAASVLAKVEQFHTDSIGCAVSALSLGANAPCVLRAEALEYPTRDAQEGVPCLASNVPVAPEKAILANCAAAPMEPTAVTTRARETRAVSLVTTISIPSPSPPPNLPGWTAIARRWP